MLSDTGWEAQESLDPELEVGHSRYRQTIDTHIYDPIGQEIRDSLSESVWKYSFLLSFSFMFSTLEDDLKIVYNLCFFCYHLF